MILARCETGWHGICTLELNRETNCAEHDLAGTNRGEDRHTRIHSLTHPHIHSHTHTHIHACNYHSNQSWEGGNVWRIPLWTIIAIVSRQSFNCIELSCFSIVPSRNMITNVCPNCVASTCWIFARSDRYHLAGWLIAANKSVERSVCPSLVRNAYHNLGPLVIRRLKDRPHDRLRSTFRRWQSPRQSPPDGFHPLCTELSTGIFLFRFYPFCTFHRSTVWKERKSKGAINFQLSSLLI